MPAPVKILAFAGSLRKESWNKKLVRAAAESLAGTPDVGVTVIDLADYPLPLFNEDIYAAQGLPENARKLRALFAEHQGFLISSPEFSGSYTGVLKNVFDWLSVKDDKVAGEPFKGKAAALLSASPGQRGGLRGLEKLRDLLFDLHVTVVPEIYAVGSIASAFNAAGKIEDARVAEKINRIGQQLVRAARNTL